MKHLLLAIGVVLSLSGCWESNEQKSQVKITSFESGGDGYVAYLTFTNKGESSGDYVFWIEVNGNPQCEHNYQISPNESRPLKFRCDSMPSSLGDVYVAGSWIENVPERSAAARDRYASRL